jgi:hypothetical protein
MGTQLFGPVLVSTKTRSAARFVLCTDAHGEIERYGLFEVRRVEEEPGKRARD